MADRLGVTSLPTVLFMAEGRVVHRFEGAAPVGYMEDLVDYAFYGGERPEEPTELTPRDLF